METRHPQGFRQRTNHVHDLWSMRVGHTPLKVPTYLVRGISGRYFWRRVRLLRHSNIHLSKNRCQDGWDGCLGGRWRRRATKEIDLSSRRPRFCFGLLLCFFTMSCSVFREGRIPSSFCCWSIVCFLLAINYIHTYIPWHSLGEEATGTGKQTAS